MTRVRALITGFEPFGKYEVNPTEVILRNLPGAAARELPGLEVVVATLPVSFRRAGEALSGLLSAEKPDIYIGTGLRPGATHIAVERVAVNLMDARAPDNDGAQPVDEPIDPSGPAAYFSTLPVKAIVKRMKEERIPAAVSNSAGTFLCNYAMYLALHNSHRFGYPTRSGFIHIPFSQDMASDMRWDWAGIPPSLHIETALRGVIIAVKETVERFHVGDIRASV